MSERAIRADGLERATQSFGDPAHPATLLIMGGMASMLWWPQEFLQLARKPQQDGKLHEAAGICHTSPLC
jgi:hypothetical protein